jgi:hypothetical protein
MSLDLFDDIEGLDGAGLRGEARNNLIVSMLPGFISEGITATDSLGIFRDNGFAIKDSTFYSLYNSVLGREAQQNRIRFVGSNAVPTEGILDSYNTPLDSKYKFVFQYTYENPDTGATETSYFGHNRNTLDTRANMEADAADDLSERYPARGENLIDIKIWKGFIAQ